jgi:uncharacterized protein (DUF2336 family)
MSSLIQELEHAIASGTPKKRQKALTLITDLFIAGSGRYSSDQIALFDDVLVTLSATIEMKARVRLSKRMATIPDAPAKVVRSLAFDDEAAVAAPMLKDSPQLTDDDLVAAAGSKSQSHLQAITQRRELSEAVTDALVEHGDRDVVRSVARNSGARFSDVGFGKLIARARGDDMLARYVGTRRDIPRHHFLKLLETASASVRSKLEAANPDVGETIRDIVAEITTHISHEVRSASQEHAKAKARVKRLCTTSQFSEADVHAFARAHNFEQTVVALSVLGNFPIELTERALLDESPDMVLILAKAARCCWSTTKAILFMSAANRSMSVMDLDHAFANFDRLQVQTAKQALEFYSMRHKCMSQSAPQMKTSAAASLVRFPEAQAS